MEKEMNVGREILLAVDTFNCTIVLAENLYAASPYCTWKRSGDATRYSYDIGHYFSTYPEALADLGKRVTEQAAAMVAWRKEFGYIDDFYAEKDCVPLSLRMNLLHEVVVIRPELLAHKYRLPENQLAFVTHGFGASPNAHTDTIHCTYLVDGEQTAIGRGELYGAILLDRLPEWAHKKATSIREQWKSDRSQQHCDR